ncbi:MAG: hypothetical protein RQM92_10955 [Candidatus Syntrophopropionicum ammoniitolerans]
MTEALHRAAGSVATFTLKLSGVGVFPSRERPGFFGRVSAVILPSYGS